jgi:hypothetical protein
MHGNFIGDLKVHKFVVVTFKFQSFLEFYIILRKI